MRAKLLIGLIAICTLSNAQYTKLLDFDGNANGSNPLGSLISDGTFLYGMTTIGGANNLGVIFQIKPDGTGYNKLLDFSGVANGSHPNGDLFSDGTYLYGMTSNGGTNNSGVLFKIKPNGTGYVKLLNFIGSSNGGYPHGNLISDGTFLYGMTSEGGANGYGTIFKIKPDGTGYFKLLDFSDTDGSRPNGSLIYDNTFLYGMTQQGGTNNAGVVFKIKTDGTAYSKLKDFTGSLNGESPSGSLISDGAFLYGMTSGGGTTSNGLIFKIKPDGTGYSDIFDFADTSGVGPGGSLISDGNFLYGMTPGGGLYGDGLIFKIKLDGTEYSRLFNFGPQFGPNGNYPQGSLVSDGTFLYGMTQNAGTNGFGIIFKFNIASVGIGELDTSYGINIFPNPCMGTFIIATKENNHLITITNMLGEDIYQSEIKSQKSEIDLSSQSKGIYFVKIYEGNRIHLEKIVIQ